MSKSIFSPTEQKVLTIINRTRGLNTKEIAEKLYYRRVKPKHYRMIVSNAISRIQKKTERHKLQWTLKVWNFGCKGKSVSKVRLP